MPPHIMMLGGCLTVCWVYPSSNLFPGGLLTVILRVPKCWIVDSSEKNTVAHCSSLHVICFFANCNRLVFKTAVSRGFLAGLCEFKLNCLTRRQTNCTSLNINAFRKQCSPNLSTGVGCRAYCYATYHVVISWGSFGWFLNHFALNRHLTVGKFLNLTIA